MRCGGGTGWLFGLKQSGFLAVVVAAEGFKVQTSVSKVGDQVNFQMNFKINF